MKNTHVLYVLSCLATVNGTKCFSQNSQSKMVARQPPIDHHGKLFLTGIDIRFDNVIVFIDFSNCLPLIDTAIIGKVN